ncbi:hypothetical protein AB4098_09465 [Vibrio cyclitrophicus]
MIQLTRDQIAELDFLANAIADSFTLDPHTWLFRYGPQGTNIGPLPKEYKHLIKDYVETKREMMKTHGVSHLFIEH